MATGQFNNDYLGLIGDEDLKRIQELNKGLDETKAKIIEINTAAKGMGSGTFADSVGQQQQLQQKTKEATAELQRQRELKKLQAAEERELNRLIAEEERDNIRKVKADESAANKERMQDRRNYENLYKQLLKEREKAEADAAAAARKAAEQQRKAAVDAVDLTSIKGLTKTLRDLENGYDRLTRAERENVNIGGVLKKRLIEIRDEVNKSNFATKRFGGNVGNYPQMTELERQVKFLAGELPNLQYGFKLFLSSLSNQFQGLSESIKNAVDQNKQLRAEGKPTTSVFNQIAGSLLNWQTALLVIAALLPTIIDFFTKGSKAAQAAKKANDEYRDSLKDIDRQSRQTSQEEILKAQILLRVAEDVTASTQKRKHAVEELQRLYPNYLGNLSEEAIKSGKAREALDELTNAILANALAKANADKYALATNARFDRNQAVALAEQALSKSETKLRSAQSGGLVSQSQYGTVNSTVVSAEQAVFSARKELEIAKKAAEDAQSEVVKFAVATQNAMNSIPDLFTKPKKDKKAGGSGSINRYTGADIANARAFAANPGLEKQSELQENAAINKAIVDNDRLSLRERTEAYRLYVVYKKAQIQNDKNTQIAEARATIKELNKEEAGNNSLIASGKTKQAARESLREKNKAITDQITTLNQQIQRLQRESVREQNAIQAEGDNDLQSIRESNARKRVQQLTIDLQDISNQESEARASQKDELNRQYDEGEITFKQYRERIGQINADEDNITLARQKEFLKTALENLLKEADVPPEVIAAVRRQLNAAYDKQSGNKGTDLGFRGSAAAGASYLSKAGQELSPYTSAINSAMNVFEAASKKRSDSIDKEIEKIRERAEVEVAAVEYSAQYATLTESQKAEKIAQINKQAADKEKILEREKVERQRKMAAFQKAITLATIAIQTALAVTQALAEPGLPIYLKIANSIAAGILGAVQLAAAAATPLPAYARGGFHKDAGAALVGDGGRREVVMLEDGSLYLTPSSDTVVDLPANTTIFPSMADYLRNAPNPMTPQLNKERNKPISTQKMERLLNRVASGIDEIASFGPARLSTFEMYRQRKLNRR